MRKTMLAISIGILVTAAIAAGGYFLLFPLKYKAALAEAARNYELSPAFVAAVVRTESRFKSTALSKRGAVGLMQMMPATAAWQASKLGLERYDLNNPEDNLELGCAYLKYLWDRYAGNATEALAAYNAGPSNVDDWKRDEDYSVDGRLRTIPFAETANYVKKVLSAEKWYRVRF